MKKERKEALVFLAIGIVWSVIAFFLLPRSQDAFAWRLIRAEWGPIGSFVKLGLMLVMLVVYCGGLILIWQGMKQLVTGKREERKKK